MRACLRHQRHRGARAERLIELYQAQGIHIDRVLIKIAATWEGIQAAEKLERAASTATSRCCSRSARRWPAAGRVQLISPFVGRIYDWYKKAGRRQLGRGRAQPAPTTPACNRCAQIYNHYKHFGIATEVMGASFRNIGQITALAGCDLLTISPELLAQLQASRRPATGARPEAARTMTAACRCSSTKRVSALR
jgi:transaldolase